MYDLLHLQDSPGQPQRADLPCLRGPYRRTRRGVKAARAVETAGLVAFTVGCAALDSTGAIGDWAVFLTCAGLLVLALWAGKGKGE